MAFRCTLLVCALAMCSHTLHVLGCYEGSGEICPARFSPGWGIKVLPQRGPHVTHRCRSACARVRVMFYCIDSLWLLSASESSCVWTCSRSVCALNCVNLSSLLVDASARIFDFLQILHYGAFSWGEINPFVCNYSDFEKKGYKTKQWGENEEKTTSAPVTY